MIRTMGPERPRPSILSLATIGLAIATLLVLTQIARLMVSPVASPDRESAHRLLVHRFYDAVNTTLATGNTDAFDEIVETSFSDETNGDDSEMGREALVNRLLVLRSLQPHLRLVVREVVAGARLAVAWVAIEGNSIGFPLAAPDGVASGESIDRLTIADGRVIEFRGIIWNLNVGLPILQADIPTPAQRDVVIGLARLTLDAATPPFALSSPGPFMVAAASGTVQLGSSGTLLGVPLRTAANTSTTASNGQRELLPSAQVVSSAGSPIALSNPGSSPVDLWLVAVIPASAFALPMSSNYGDSARPLVVTIFDPNDSPETGDDVAPPGVRWARSINERLVLTGDRQAIRLERIDLAANTEMSVQSGAGGIIIAVEPTDTELVLQQTTAGTRPSLVSMLGPSAPVLTAPGTSAKTRNLGDSTAALVLLSWQWQ